jgi:hypothetical protein
MKARGPKQSITGALWVLPLPTMAQCWWTMMGRRQSGVLPTSEPSAMAIQRQPVNHPGHLDHGGHRLTVYRRGIIPQVVAISARRRHLIHPELLPGVYSPNSSFFIALDGAVRHALFIGGSRCNGP